MILKLFVWQNVLTDYSSGIMFALAPDVETARRVIIEKVGDFETVEEDLRADPLIITESEGFGVWGGS